MIVACVRHGAGASAVALVGIGVSFGPPASDKLTHADVEVRMEQCVWETSGVVTPCLALDGLSCDSYVGISKRTPRHVEPRAAKAERLFAVVDSPRPSDVSAAVFCFTKGCANAAWNIGMTLWFGRRAIAEYTENFVPECWGVDGKLRASAADHIDGRQIVFKRYWR